MPKVQISLDEITHVATHFANSMATTYPNRRPTLYGVPRGGVSAALAMAASGKFLIVDKPEDAGFIVDDLIDSGATREAWFERFPDTPFIALYSKCDFPRQDTHYAVRKDKNCWLVFPWEGTEEKSADDIVTRLLQFIGEDAEREGLRETPDRVVAAWGKWFDGYDQKPESVLKHFEDGAEKYDEMILVRDIPVYSHCEHHLAPFFGTAHIGYIPNGRIVGLSKIPRLVDIFSHRLQVQERLTSQIAGALHDHLEPKGVGVVLKCRHLCMESRGIRLPGTMTITSAMRGALLNKPEARAEFFSLVR